MIKNLQCSEIEEMSSRVYGDDNEKPQIPETVPEPELE